MSELDTIDTMFNKLDTKGQGYMYEMLGYGRDAYHAKTLQYVLNKRSQARSNHTLSKLQSQLGLKYQSMNQSVNDSAKGIPSDERNEVDKFFNSDDYVKSLQNENVYKDFTKEHYSDLAKFSNVTPTHGNSMARQGISMYKVLSPQGRRYFDVNLHYARQHPSALDRVKFGSPDSLKLAGRRVRQRIMNTRLGVSRYRGRTRYGKQVPVNEAQKVDDFFEQNRNAKAGQFSDIVNQVSTFKDARIAERAEEAHRNYQKKVAQSKKPKIDPQEAQEEAHQSVPIAKQGIAIYRDLSKQGQRYFRETLNQAHYNPKMFHKTRNLSSAALTAQQRNYRYKLDNLARGNATNRHGELYHFSDPVPDDEKTKIDNYFKRSDIIPAISYGVLSDHLNKYYNDEVQKRVQKDVNKQQPGVDYKRLANQGNSQYAHDYQRMMAKGSQLYDKLTPQGRRYLLDSARSAALNLDDYNKAMHGDAKSLTPRQRKLRTRLQRASGWKQSENGDKNGVIMSKNYVPKSEKNEIDQYLSDEVTQNGLKHGDAYDTIVLRNIRNRQIQETEKDEDSEEQKFDRKLNGMKFRAYKHSLDTQHPWVFRTFYAMGLNYGLKGGAPGAYKRAKQRAKNLGHQVSGDLGQRTKKQIKKTKQRQQQRKESGPNSFQEMRKRLMKRVKKDVSQRPHKINFQHGQER